MSRVERLQIPRHVMLGVGLHSPPPCFRLTFSEVAGTSPPPAQRLGVKPPFLVDGIERCTTSLFGVRIREVVGTCRVCYCTLLNASTRMVLRPPVPATPKLELETDGGQPPRDGELSVWSPRRFPTGVFPSPPLSSLSCPPSLHRTTFASS